MAPDDSSAEPSVADELALVRATRSGQWWALETLVGGQPIYTQVRDLTEAEAAVRDACRTLDVRVGSLAVEVEGQR